MTTPNIQLKNVSKRYNRPIFSHLNVSWEGTGLICIDGENGSGKTTLLTMLAGAEDYDQGEIRIMGHHIRDAVAKSFLFFVPDLCPVYPFLKGEEWLVFVSLAHRVEKALQKKLVDEFNLSNFLATPFSEMSFGTSKKFLLTAALSCQLPILILDEPTNGLDNHSFEILQHYLKMQSQNGLTIYSCLDQEQQKKNGG